MGTGTKILRSKERREIRQALDGLWNAFDYGWHVVGHRLLNRRHNRKHRIANLLGSSIDHVRLCCPAELVRKTLLKLGSRQARDRSSRI